MEDEERTIDSLPVGSVLVPIEGSGMLGVWVVLDVSGPTVVWLNLETGVTYTDNDGDEVLHGSWDVYIPEGAE